MVTPKNPDENVNHLPSAAPCKNGVSNGETADKKSDFYHISSQFIQ